MPKPVDTSTIADAGAKTTRGPGTGSQSRVIPNFEDIVKKVNNLNLDEDLTEFLVSSLQDLSKLFTAKARDIKAAVRDGIIENFIVPIVDKFAARETSFMATIFDLKAKNVDTDLVFYQAKVRECENTIEGLRAKLQLVSTDLSDAKDELKKTSSALVETAKEVRTLIDQPRPSYTEVLRSSPVALSNAPVISKRDNHVVLLRPVKPSTSEENIKVIENVLTARNSATRISRIGKVSQGGLIIEAPTEADLQALEAEIGCLPKLEERFTVSRPKRRRPQIIILGVDNSVDKDRLLKGLLAKNHFLADSKNHALIDIIFPIKARRSTNWVASVDPGIYKLIFDQPGLYFEFSRLRFDNFFGVKQCHHCKRFGHTTKWCPRKEDTFCTRCGMDHPVDTCKDIICVNCTESNQRFKSGFNVNHGPKDKVNCNSFLRQKDNLIRLTDYGPSPGSSD
ncbi:hypothetical protein AVEN_170019-1 [Araneus ventricosus]|uniref:CCHC-type domain-containing protein n=1 Tax=Araneus ventricosus TaxID=182803 RepID=A0A4Y2Q0F7_ARAVE|nr:hypothetical protein AVEN_170019-1 [Araneus ventricosus]